MNSRKTKVNALIPLFLALIPLLLSHTFAADVYEYRCKTPLADTGYCVASKNYLDDFDPAFCYPPATEFRAFATPGEDEPVALVIYAAQDLPNIHITVTDLMSDPFTIPKESITIRTVVRAPRRRTYQSPPEDSHVVSRFLFPFTPFVLAKGHFREIWFTIHVPENAAHGLYTGAIEIAPPDAAPTRLPMTLEVFPLTLPLPSPKRYGVYHRVDPKTSHPDRLEAELTDIRRHGGTLIYPHLSIEFSKTTAGDITVSYETIAKGTELLRHAGFHGPIIIGTGLTQLQRLLKLEHEELETNDAFLSHARTSIGGLKDVQKDFPHCEFVLSHLDEVFNRNRLPRYIALTKTAQQVPGFRYYITFHTVNDEADKQRAIIDPFVDIRGHHGYTFEWWLARGHTFAECETELRKSGDEAWFYLNPNRVWRDAKFQRLVNGLYMWASSFSGRLDWGYSHPVGDPFNDLDGKSTDTGYVFWTTTEPAQLIATTDWEAWREGIDDMKYLLMLQHVIGTSEGTDAAGVAAQWIDQLRARLPKPQGLTYDTRPTPQRDASESPYILALRNEFTSDDLQRIRYEAAQHIVKLLKTTKETK